MLNDFPMCFLFVIEFETVVHFLPVDLDEPRLTDEFTFLQDVDVGRFVFVDDRLDL